MIPKKEREYFDFVNRLGLQRGWAGSGNDPHTSEMSFHLLHMVLGMVTESGEIADLLKKHMAYSRCLDTTKLKDELGDLLFYLCGALIDIGSSLDEIVDMNIAKLKARYPNGYDHKSANNRNPDVENGAQRQVMNEGKKKKGGVDVKLTTPPLHHPLVKVKKVVNVDGHYVQKGSAEDDRRGPNGTELNETELNETEPDGAWL
jgi:NTP pyrophosphatase (non-canonical NTP hydrolase)